MALIWFPNKARRIWVQFDFRIWQQCGLLCWSCNKICCWFFKLVFSSSHEILTFQRFASGGDFFFNLAPVYWFWVHFKFLSGLVFFKDSFLIWGLRVLNSWFRIAIFLASLILGLSSCQFSQRTQCVSSCQFSQRTMMGLVHANFLGELNSIWWLKWQTNFLFACGSLKAFVVIIFCSFFVKLLHDPKRLIFNSSSPCVMVGSILEFLWSFLVWYDPIYRKMANVTWVLPAQVVETSKLFRSRKWWQHPSREWQYFLVSGNGDNIRSGNDSISWSESRKWWQRLLR